MQLYRVEARLLSGISPSNCDVEEDGGCKAVATSRENRKREVVAKGNRTNWLGCVPVCVMVRRNGERRMSRRVYTWSRSRRSRKQRCRRWLVLTLLYPLPALPRCSSHSLPYDCSTSFLLVDGFKLNSDVRVNCGRGKSGYGR